MTDKKGNVALSNADLHLTQTILRVAYYNNQHCVFNAYIPVGRTDILGYHNTGIGDPTFVGGYFFVDDKKSNTYVGLGLKVDAPWGAYDKTRVANMGSNIWRYRPLLSFAKLIMPVDLEAILYYDVKTENKDTHVNAGDLVEFESYAGYFLNQQWLAGLHFNATSGGDEEISGVKQQGTEIRDYQLGGSVTWMPTQKFSVMLQAIQDVAPRNTFKGTLILSRIVYKFK